MSLLLSTKGQVGSTSTFNENLLHVRSGGKTANAQRTKRHQKTFKMQIAEAYYMLACTPIDT
jgi:hypothetical protein